jgi:hypothetical protein
MKNIYETSINFGGFYETLHSEAVDNAVATELNYFDENNEIDYEALSDFSDWKTAQKEYGKEWIKKFNETFGTTITFINIDSPREYNFETDSIMANVSDNDIKILISYINECDIKDNLFEAIDKATTSRDGYMAFYTKREFFLKENRCLLIEKIIDTVLDYEFDGNDLVVEDFYIENKNFEIVA